MGEPTAESLKNSITNALRRQGYRIRGGRICLPEIAGKDDLRDIHTLAVRKRLAGAQPELHRYEERLLQFIANGKEVRPEAITPKLICVRRGTEDELLFRYASMHWSIPVSSGYGRRLRYLVMDESNEKLIGLFGLSDPVFSLQARDDHIGWTAEAKEARLYHVLDAFVLGAVPPYSTLLGGKLVALLTLANEVRKEFHQKYAGAESLIRKEVRRPFLAMITTTSALGRSSIYNRLRVGGVNYWQSVGWTQGSGDFHFANGVYQSMRTFVEQHCEPTAKHPTWGDGFRNKREVIRKCLSSVGLAWDLVYHGIQREVFVAPLGRDTARFLRGEVSRPCFYDWSANHLAAIFRERWLMPRAERCPEFRTFQREQYRLWPRLRK